MQIRTETKVGLFIVVAITLFFLMTLHLGYFRLDRNKYKSQVVYFDNISGLEKKAEVKIAGVKVGWVESIELVPDHEYQAKASILILKKYILHNDAYAVVRQDGLLGTKYLEVMPGDPLLPELQAGESLQNMGRTAVSMDEILYKVGNIATNVEQVTDSLKHAFGTPEGKQELRETLENFQKAAEKIASISSIIDRTLSNNEDNINVIVQDFREAVREMKERIPAVGEDVHRLAEKLELVVDRDVNAISQRFEATANAIENAAVQARDSFRNISSVTEKIDEGKGLLGKLVNDEEAYRDIKQAITGMKNYLAKIDNLNIVLDAHGEYMYSPAEHVLFEDAKGYLDVRIHPNDDHFYILQFASAQKGNLRRKILNKDWFDNENRPLLPDELLAKGIAIPELIGHIVTEERDLDAWRFGAQVGKIFKDIAVRFGLFEGFAGVGIDIDIPFGTDKLRWVTSLEAFDFRGRDRFNDNRPHLKWINRVFAFRNIYVAFGADDFISKHNANGFFGCGLRFTDDDLKYLAGRIGIAGFCS